MSADPEIIQKVMDDYDKREAALQAQKAQQPQKSNQLAGCRVVTLYERMAHFEHTAARLFAEFRDDPELHCHLGTACNAATMAAEIARKREVK